jgi:dihydroorotate dehydrogenase
MTTFTKQPIYDPKKTFEDNFDNGPFGGFDAPEIYVNKGEPTTSFLGFPVYLPFGIPAGPLPNQKFVAAAFAKGFDVVTYKTQRSVAFDCNAFPNVLYVDIEGDLTLDIAKKPLLGETETTKDPTQLTITNSFGNPSRGPDYWVPDLKKALAAEGRGQLLIMSVVGTIKPGASSDDYYDDFAHAAKLAASTGVRAIEVNLSCPNVANEGILCYTPSAVREITRRAKAAVGDIPLIAKLGYFSPAQQELLETVVSEMAPYVQAIATINTIPAPVVDKHGNQALPGPNRLISGMCGSGIKWAGLDMVRRLSKLRSEQGYGYEIMGVGGVMTPQDFAEYRAAGADVVQSATGAMWNPDLAIQIKQAK